MFVVLFIAVFGPPWTLHYWQGWTALAAFFIPSCVITVYVAKNDPALLERRLKAGPKDEKEIGQKIVQAIALVVFIADFVLPAFDRRFGWSPVSSWASIAGAIMMLIGFWITFAVFRANSFTSATIEVAENQKVISTGPYALVRHPLYTGALIMLFGIPLALGSWLGELVNIVMTIAIVWRLLDEEKLLVRELPGYAEYRGTVRHRLVPYVW
ncbi:methyltransferase family protein [Occallatibacter riparius]|uniref:Isoprenylcysteine carboxylmethyltransferase family protein n=1 Tax=Occallatibacter riparius TaxID=1002689 RepID=A0A9J7BP00_9BACT|nr:isoprenylcysteine carboxylmethyltransferase family protein [Occallatibacter riparius]UWZ82877.1 isoprenylcysteine carboxylmethyltransferase family protein [Occallatibacter riparius]